MSGGRELVLEALRHATSQDMSLLKPAEEQLNLWEIEPGFYSTLLETFSDHSLEVNVRWLAVLYFKNGIDRYWRKTAPNAIAEDEKARIRCGLLQNLHEPSPQIATQLAVLIAKIGRVDCPKDWPELLPSLFDSVRCAENLVRHRALLTMHHVVKQLASKRLSADRRTFQELTTQMFSYLLEMWESQTEAFLYGQGSDMLPHLERSYLVLKILRKLVIYGFKKPHENGEAMHFLQRVFTRMRVVMPFRKQYESNELVRGICEKYIVLLTKVLIDMLDNYPFSFLQFIKPSLDLALHYIFTSAGEGLLFERYIVQCLNLVKALLLCPEYKPCKVIEDTKEPQTLEAYKIKQEFFTESVLVGMCHKLVSHFFLLTQEDLQLWDSDPEGFSMEVDGGESWKYSLRPCTETLFISLFHEYRRQLTPALMEMVQASHARIQPNDYRGILQKDAIYNAIGLAAFELFDDVDFDHWFVTVLINELKEKGSDYRIIRRRVIWLIGQWTGVKFSPENRTTLYEACIHLLSGDEDFVVRLSAAMTLKNSMDDFEFDPEQFMPYLSTTFGLLFNLLKEAHECDTKMQVLHVMSFMIEVIGGGIQPHAAPLAQYLPALWEESTDHNMLRCAILTTLIHMVNGLMRESEGLHEFLIKVIGLSTDVNESCHVYLLEDGLQLWLATLENTSVLSEPLLKLYKNIIPLLEYSSENLRPCLQITTAYILLSPEVYLKEYGEALVQSFLSLITDIKNEGLILILRNVEMMMRVMPTDAPILLQPLLPLVILGIIQEEPYPMLLSMQLSVIARLILYMKDMFTTVILKAAESASQSGENVLEHLLIIWSDKLPLVSPEERQKLCALGLAELCGFSWPPVLKVWPSAVNAVARVIFDLTMEDSNEDKLVVDRERLGSPDDYEQETEHVQRRQALAQQDPVHTTALRAFLAQQLASLQRSVDPETMTLLFQNLDSDCKTLIQEIIAN